MHIIGRDSPAMAPDAVPDPAWLHMVVLGTKLWATFEPVPHLRISPPNNEHVAQFYVDEAHFAKSVGRFIGAALANGDAALVVATSERIATIDSALASVVDVERARIEGRYHCLDASETAERILRDGRPRPERFNDVFGSAVARALAAASGSRPRVAIYGELVALLSGEGNHAGALTLERMWNELIASHPVSLLCGYPMQSFGRIEDSDALSAICEAYTAVIPAETYPAESDDDARRRATTLLQQRSEVLERETAERHRVENALRARERELTTALASRDGFLMAAAHELKTPVTSLRVYSQLLQRDLERKNQVEPQRLASALEAIEHQTSQLTYLVGQLVDIAQIESGTLRLDRVAWDLAALIQSVVAEQDRAGTHEIVFEGDDEAMTAVDARRISQVAEILMTNALKFSPAGSRITVRVAQDADGGVRFSVMDQGPGVDEVQREQIFERFHQAHGQRHPNGLGLGLYVARQIVSLHGGSIHVEDPELPGARFVVTLPSSASPTALASVDRP